MFLCSKHNISFDKCDICLNEAIEEQNKREQVYLKKKITKVSYAKFNEMLEVLPPKRWTRIDGLESFCMIEHQTGNVTSQYGQYKGKCYHKYVDMFNKETFMTAQTLDAHEERKRIALSKVRNS